MISLTFEDIIKFDLFSLKYVSALCSLSYDNPQITLELCNLAIKNLNNSNNLNDYYQLLISFAVLNESYFKIAEFLVEKLNEAFDERCIFFF